MKCKQCERHVSFFHFKTYPYHDEMLEDKAEDTRRKISRLVEHARVCSLLSSDEIKKECSRIRLFSHVDKARLNGYRARDILNGTYARSLSYSTLLANSAHICGYCEKLHAIYEEALNNLRRAYLS